MYQMPNIFYHFMCAKCLKLVLKNQLLSIEFIFTTFLKLDIGVAITFFARIIWLQREMIRNIMSLVNSFCPFLIRKEAQKERHKRFYGSHRTGGSGDAEVEEKNGAGGGDGGGARRSEVC